MVAQEVSKQRMSKQKPPVVDVICYREEKCSAYNSSSADRSRCSNSGCSSAYAGAVIGGASLSGAKGRVIGAVLDRPLLHGSLLSSPSRWLFARQFPHPLVLGISDAGANDA
jgi:hypothetical protein